MKASVLRRTCARAPVPCLWRRTGTDSVSPRPRFCADDGAVHRMQTEASGCGECPFTGRPRNRCEKFWLLVILHVIGVCRRKREDRAMVQKVSVVFPCLNCDQPAAPVAGQAKLYCSEGCAEEAKTVRYVRGCIRDGRIQRPDVLEAARIKLAMVVGGGYPEQERRLAPSVRKAVIARDNRLCKLCGKPGTDIDHIDGNSDEMKNLQLLCRTCHNKKTISGFVPVSPEHQAKANELRIRISASKPIRPCDDDEHWTTVYPQIQAKRQAALTKAVAGLMTQKGMANKGRPF